MRAPEIILPCIIACSAVQYEVQFSVKCRTVCSVVQCSVWYSLQCGTKSSVVQFAVQYSVQCSTVCNASLKCSAGIFKVHTELVLEWVLPNDKISRFASRNTYWPTTECSVNFTVHSLKLSKNTKI